MIDEKKLIEEIENTGFFIAGLRSGKEMLRKYLTEYRKAIVKIINNQPKVGEWIPCSERLPIGEEYKKKIEDEWFYKKVLTTEEGKMYSGWYDQEDECWYDVQGFMMYPVAWQPLPNPYNAK